MANAISRLMLSHIFIFYIYPIHQSLLKKSPVIVIIRLILTHSIWPKMITLNGFCFTSYYRYNVIILYTIVLYERDNRAGRQTNKERKRERKNHLLFIMFALLEFVHNVFEHVCRGQLVT
jgi:hypothetical protein